MKISLCMIVKNEEKNIVNCLDRALKVVDEAVIVDTGSTDKTKDLLIENYGRNPKVKIIEYKWESDFSKARNKSLEYATGDWILVLDADERIFCNRDRLEDFLESREDKAYIIPIYNVIDRDSITISSTMIRLFRNENPNYQGAIHEQICVDGKTLAVDKIEGNICRIYHYGYTDIVFKEKGKQDRNMGIIKAQIEEEPDNPFHWYNKGVMEMCEKNYDAAIDDFIKSHGLTNKVRMAFHNDLVIRLMQCMIIEKDYKKAIEFIKTVAEDPYIGKIPDIYYYCGIAYANTQKYSSAIKYFKKAIEKGEYEKGTSKYGAGSFLPKIEWAKVLLMEKKKEEAIAKYKEAVFDENNVNRQGLEELKYLLKEENKIEELNQLEKDLSNPKSKENSLNTNQLNNADFDKYKSEVKENIKILVENGMLKEAKEAIKEYEKIVKDDIDIYSIKGVIAMMEGDMDEAEKVLDKVLLINSNNNDILYNIAYLYRDIRVIHKAIYFYKKLYHKAEDIELKKEAKDAVEALGGSLRNSVLIGSPIRQKPLILEEFLKSLEELNKEGLDVDYFFIDDNDNEKSNKLIRQFSENKDNVIIYKVQSEDMYICDENTHNWKENLVWKVARFKDKIIEYAKNKNYDYLFFIDSDLVLHPNTLKQLISTGKDIISEIFWTKWQTGYPALPQVWLKDFYTQYESSREEILDQNEINKRHKEFIDRLRIPGIYEVGGLGACTLVSKYAIDKGVNFKEIRNISFAGEDRHFCIRAVALGLSLYVDTHYPAYHIYRDKDLENVAFIKKKNKAKKITLINTNYSGSNSIAMFKYIPKHIKEKYCIEMVNQSNSSEFEYKIMNSDVVITTEGNYHFNKKTFNEKQLVIDLWHGFPLKAMGYVDKGETFKGNIKSIWNNIDYISSYSELFNIVMNKCINTQKEKYKVLGASRNDFLFTSHGRQSLALLLNKEFDDKFVIFYMPTYRYSTRGHRKEGCKHWKNYFGFDSFNKGLFNKFLMGKNIELIIKLHPSDENFIINNIDVSRNIHILSDKLLRKNGIDLYEILNGCDLLITDYSSVYFDLLLLDKPIIFIPTDLKEYEDSRGFLLKPYDAWTPGPKCLSQESLEEEIIKSLSSKNYYKKERTNILNKVHYYKDGHSTKRTWDFIDSLLK